MKDNINISDVIMGYFASGKVDGLRLGQWFVNNYYNRAWPQLYYEESYVVALEMIERFISMEEE